MPVNLSIKNVPDEIAAQLRQRAAKNHRSLQGELLAIIEKAVSSQQMTPLELLDKVHALGLQTASDSRAMVREDRDAR
jgi:plasmid stability protein